MSRRLGIQGRGFLVDSYDARKARETAHEESEEPTFLRFEMPRRKMTGLRDISQWSYVAMIWKPGNAQWSRYGRLQ